MSYVDKTLTCRDCGSTFTFTAGEQEFYAQKGFTNAPSRCANCRSARKAGGLASGARGGSSSYASGYDDRGGYSAGYERGSYDRSSGGRGMGVQREMHTAICASCGKEARVPFVPRGDKPVYCSDCFQERGGRSRWNS